MFSQLGKAFFALTLNALMIVGLLLGFGVIQEAVVSIVQTGTQTFSELKVQILDGITALLSQEPHYLLGAIFCVGVITYDIVLIYSWFRSVSFTSVKNCKRCRHKIIREPRTSIDRIISIIVALKRYRCVGCGKEYLVFQRFEKKSVLHVDEHQPAYVKRD